MFTGVLNFHLMNIAYSLTESEGKMSWISVSVSYTDNITINEDLNLCFSLAIIII